MFSFFRRTTKKEAAKEESKNKTDDDGVAAVHGERRPDASTTNDHVATTTDSACSITSENMAPMAAARGRNKKKQKQNRANANKDSETESVRSSDSNRATNNDAKQIQTQTSKNAETPGGKVCTQTQTEAPKRTDPTQQQHDATPNAQTLTISYSNALKTSENVKKVLSVKPCSHVTVPLSSVKLATPPGSPPVKLKSQNPPGNVENGTQLDNEKRNLVNQEAKFQTQLTDLSQKLSAREAETITLQFQMEELHRDLYIKASGMDRLQAELQAAHKDSESVRQKLRHLQEDISAVKQKNFELIEELQKKTDECRALEASSKEEAARLESRVSELSGRVKDLESQIDSIQAEKQRIEQQRAAIEAERREEKRIVQEALDAATTEKENIQKRWESDFEKLRTVNTDREQQMLDDFEWKLREVEQRCKKKLDEKQRAADERIKEAHSDIEAKVKVAEHQLNEVLHLKSYEAEVTQLRGLTHDQQRSLQSMSRRAEQLQLAEQDLQEEIGRLQAAVEQEKASQLVLQCRHEKELADRERALQIRLEEQKGEVAVQWELKLRQECARLKAELDQVHAEEKHLAIELVKVQKDQEFTELKAHWHTKLQDSLNEIGDLKKTIVKKDEKYQNDVERLQTNTDHDIIELRRAIDKTEMLFHDKIEKMLEEHEKEIERLNEEAEKRTKELEANCQLQVSSMRATLELVKEQMERDSQDKIIALAEQHRTHLETQWEKLTEEKAQSAQLIEQEYRCKYEKLKEQFMVLQKSQSVKEHELLQIIESLRTEVQEKRTVIDDLQSNVDTLHGGIQVLNQELASQDQQPCKFNAQTQQKIRSPSELQQLLNKERAQLQMEREEHLEEMTHMQKQSQAAVLQLQRKCQCLSKLFEDMRSRFDGRESRPEDVCTIRDLRNALAEQERDLSLLNEEKRFFQLELLKRRGDRYATKEDLSLSSHTWKGGASPPSPAAQHFLKSKSLDTDAALPCSRQVSP